MSTSIFSNHWYKVSKLIPELKKNAFLTRHVYRHRVWYVIEDKTSGRVHRFNEKAYEVIGLCDGQRNIQEIWGLTNSKLGDDALTQDQMIDLFSRLYRSDLLISNAQPDYDEIIERIQARKKGKLTEKLMSPMSLRFSLLDPDHFLDKTIRYVNFVFTKTFAAVWLMTILLAFAMMLSHWGELTNNVTQRMFSAQNLMILWVIYPLVKILHELGHAYAAKKWGGEVHTMGFVLLVLIPFPYVDASSASNISDKYKRMVVGAAGMMVELFLASIALFVWLIVDSIFIQTICFNIMMIGCVSTLVFNGNPLMKYDGYYILSDYIEIPNLTGKSKQYLAYLAKRYLFKLNHNNGFDATTSEKAWYLNYGIFSFLYRISVVLLIAAFVAQKFFVFGVVLAIWGILTQIVIPLIKQLHFLFRSPQLERQRSQSVTKVFSFAFILFIFVSFVPLPEYTKAEGVVWLPDDAVLRAGSDGFVSKLYKRSSSKVLKDEVIVQLEEPSLTKRNEILLYELKEAKAKWTNKRTESTVETLKEREKVNLAQSKYAHGLEKQVKLDVKAQSSGNLILLNQQDLIGSYKKNGDVIGYIIGESKPVIKVSIHQNDMGLIRSGVKDIEVRSIHKVSKVMHTTLLREHPNASHSLPSNVLGTEGGGNIDINSEDKNGTQALELFFTLDLALPQHEQPFLGSRMYVRFYHGNTPLLTQWISKMRRIFMRQFNV